MIRRSVVYQDSKTGELLSVKGRPVAHCEFQTSLGYIKLYLKIKSLLCFKGEKKKKRKTGEPGIMDIPVVPSTWEGKDYWELKSALVT